MESSNYLNYKVYYPKNNNSSIIKAIRNNRIWEKKLLPYFDKYVNENSNVIDIGCYVGTHSLYLSNLCNKVYAFDPQQFVGECFQKTIKENNIDNIEFFNYAIHNHNCLSLFGTNNDGDASLIKERNKLFTDEYYVVTEKLDYFDLDNISLIKIDAEGSEANVLEGAEETIHKCKPVILIEIWKSKKRINTIKNWCKNNNYDLSKISGDDYILLPQI